MDIVHRAEENAGVVVFSDIAFCTLFLRILEDAENELAFDPLTLSIPTAGRDGGVDILDVVVVDISI